VFNNIKLKYRQVVKYTTICEYHTPLPDKNEISFYTHPKFNPNNILFVLCRAALVPLYYAMLDLMMAL